VNIEADIAEISRRIACQPAALSPFGLLFEAAGGAQPSIAELPVKLLKPLLLEHRCIVLRGFQQVAEKQQFGETGRQWGELLEWDFGAVFEVEQHAAPDNYLFTPGSVPYHWDGAFAAQAPWLQLFQCLAAPATGAGGETIFCDTTALWRSLPAATQQQWLDIEIEYGTDKVAHYGGSIRAPLVAKHPQTGETVLRFAEPANATTVDLNTPTLKVHGAGEQSEAALLRDITAAVYDPRFVYAHRWQSGDFLIADNHTLLHGRNSYQQLATRKLWRVHIL